MGFFKRLIDLITLRTERPMRRLLAYYLVLLVVIVALSYAFPVVDRMFTGAEGEIVAATPELLQDGTVTTNEILTNTPGPDMRQRLELALKTIVICLATLALMLPVTWVYMSAQSSRSHNQSVAQTLMILPLIVGGIILVVSNSLALAFSLAGVVSVLRFRTRATEMRDVMFVFLGVAVGFAAGVQQLTVAVVLSMLFNFVLLFSWQYDFGRNVLEPTAAAVWSAPLDLLSKSTNGSQVPDRDLVVALTPTQVDNLAKRFERVRSIVGSDAKKPRYNGILTVTTNALTDAQDYVERALARTVKRWKLDQVVTNEGKPSEMYYLVRVGASTTEDEVLTAVRSSAANSIVTATLELGNALAREAAQKKEAKAGDEVV